MAKILSNAGIVTGLPVEAKHVSQSVNALTAAEAYDINISGSLTANTLTYPFVDGTADQSLLTDGSGQITIRTLETVPTASFVTSSGVYGPYGSNSIVSSSYAVTSSYSNFATLASSSLFSINSQNATTATSASYALTASFALNGGGGGSGSFATTASFALTASYIEMANAYRQNISESTATITHNRDSEDVLVVVYKATGTDDPVLIIPSSVTLTNTNTAVVAFSNIVEGYVIVTDGKGVANNSVTSSYAITASYALNAGSGGGSSSGSYVSSSTSGDNITFTKGDGSQITNKIISSSYSLTASYALNGGSGGSSNAYVSSSTTGNQINFNRSSGGVVITPIISASHATTAISSSYAITASYLLGFIQSASYALTSSYAVSSSHAEFADSSSYAALASTASLATTAITSSYALTASFVIGSIESASYALRAETVRTVTYPARNDDNVIIQKGDPVFVTEVNNGIYDIRKAEALDPNKMPAVGVAATTAALGASVEMLLIGEIKNTNTFGANPGRNIYVAANGGYSQTKPLAPAFIQPIGIIAEASATEGVLLINGPMADMSSGSASVPTASYVSSSNVDGPFGFDSILTSSYALTASHAQTAISSSYAITASHLIGTTQSASNAISSSYAVSASNAISSSYAVSSSHASYSLSSSIAEYTSEWNLTADGTNNYLFNGPGFTSSAADPDIYLVRGQKYKFTNNMGAHPFRIQTTVNGSTGTAYANGVTNNDVSNGTLLFNVPMQAPDVLYYQCTSHPNMGGKISIPPAVTSSYAITSSYALTASYVLSDSTNSSYRESVSGTTTYTIVHNLNENFPIVQAYELASLSQEIPQSVTSTNASTISVSFINNFDGTIVVIK